MLSHVKEWLFSRQQLAIDSKLASHFLIPTTTACKKCNKIYYCGRKCAKEDSKIHKKECGKQNVMSTVAKHKVCMNSKCDNRKLVLHFSMHGSFENFLKANESPLTLFILTDEKNAEAHRVQGAQLVERTLNHTKPSKSWPFAIGVGSTPEEACQALKLEGMPTHAILVLFHTCNLDETKKQAKKHWPKLTLRNPICEEDSHAVIITDTRCTRFGGPGCGFYNCGPVACEKHCGFLVRGAGAPLTPPEEERGASTPPEEERGASTPLTPHVEGDAEDEPALIASEGFRSMTLEEE